MENNKMNNLVAKYNEGLADPSEIKLLEQWIEEGLVDLTQLRELAALDMQLMKQEEAVPSLRMDDQFHAMLSEEKRKLKRGPLSFQLPEWNYLFPRLAMAASLLLAGFIGGYWLQRPGVQPEVLALTKEVSEMKEMMVLSLLEKESATERLRAVSLTDDMEQVSAKVTKALFQTLNHDPNVNVRLAALEALKPYTKQSEVRQELIHSISEQDSPLVQVTLADLMVSIQEKKSVGALQKLLDSDRTPKDVKNKIKKSIEVLI